MRYKCMLQGWRATGSWSHHRGSCTSCTSSIGWPCLLCWLCCAACEPAPQPPALAHAPQERTRQRLLALSQERRLDPDAASAALAKAYHAVTRERVLC